MQKPPANVQMYHGGPYPPPPPPPSHGYHPGGVYKSAPSLVHAAPPATGSSYVVPYATLPPQSASTVTVSVAVASTATTPASAGGLPTTITAAAAAPPTPATTNFSGSSPHLQPAVHPPQLFSPLYAPYRSTPYMPSALSNAAVSIFYYCLML